MSFKSEKLDQDFGFRDSFGKIDFPQLSVIFLTKSICKKAVFGSALPKDLVMARMKGNCLHIPLEIF